VSSFQHWTSTTASLVRSFSMSAIEDSVLVVPPVRDMSIIFLCAFCEVRLRRLKILKAAIVACAISPFSSHQHFSLVNPRHSRNRIHGIHRPGTGKPRKMGPRCRYEPRSPRQTLIARVPTACRGLAAELTGAWRDGKDSSRFRTPQYPPAPQHERGTGRGLCHRCPFCKQADKKPWNQSRRPTSTAQTRQRNH
jgi:hypothetical protein